jgi:hypothetical protein
MLRQRRGHLPASGLSFAGWSYPEWGLEGADPSVSIYDEDFGASASQLHREVAGGVETLIGEQRVNEPTMTRRGRVSAQHNTLPAARFFNQLGGASGTGHNWSANTTVYVPHGMNMNANPGAIGAAELHPATSYNPFPSPAELYPKVV